MSTVPWSPDFEEILRTYLPLLDADQAIGRHTALVDYGLDSMAAVSLLLELEERYGVVIADSELGGMTSADAGRLWAALRLGTPAATLATEPADG